MVSQKKEVNGIIAADANSDGVVDAADKTLWENSVGTAGYLPEDFNLDGQVNNSDKNDMWEPNVVVGAQLPE